MKSVKVFVCGLASAVIAGASFTAFPVSATNAVIEYTLTPAETVAYYGITPPQGSTTNAGMNMFVWYYTDDSQTETQIFSAARRVLDYTVLDLEGNEWVVIEYTYQTAAFVDRRNELQYTIWAQPALQFANLYSITKGYGFQGADTRAQNPQSNYAHFNWFLGESDSPTTQVQASDNVFFPLKENGAYQTERWRRADTGGLFVCNSVTHTASSILPNIQLRKAIGDTVYYCAPNSTIIEDASGTSYSRMLVRCPTIRYAQSDEEAIKESLQDIMDALTLSEDPAPAVSSVATQASADASAVSSAIGEEHDFLHSFQYSGFPEGYDPTYSDDAVGLFAILFRFWENNQYAITVSAGAMALALVSYILYGRKF